MRFLPLHAALPGVLRRTSYLWRQFSTATPSKELPLPEIISIKMLARNLGVKVKQVHDCLKSSGEVPDDSLSFDVAEYVAMEFGYTVRRLSFGSQALSSAAYAKLPRRPPVIALLGHVDHGKTTLLDYIRNTSRASAEAGGITQTIGAFMTAGQNPLTFIDTPGHAAFQGMRTYGASAADICVLVVSGMEGIKEQTKENIRLISERAIPTVVAVTKVDLPGCDIEGVENSLMQYNILSERHGGDTPVMGVSALSGAGIPQLLDAIRLQSELLDIRADPKLNPSLGLVIESRLDRALGPTASLILRDGTLQVGQWVQVGATYGKIRTMSGALGGGSAGRLKKAEPGWPVEVSGFKGVPEPGALLMGAASESEAKQLVHYFGRQQQDGEETREQKRTSGNEREQENGEMESGGLPLTDAARQEALLDQFFAAGDAASTLASTTFPVILKASDRKSVV